MPAVSESSLIRWEGGNHKSRKLISCISSHQKGSATGHIFTSGSESGCSGLGCREAPALLTVTRYEEGKTSLNTDEERTFLACITDPYGGWWSSTALGWSFGSAKGAPQGPGSPHPAAKRAGSANLPWGLLKMLQPPSL